VHRAVVTNHHSKPLRIPEERRPQHIVGYSTVIRGRDSSVGIATRYGLDCPGIETRWGLDFPHPSKTGRGVHPAYYTMYTGSFPGVERSGRDIDLPPPSSAEVEGRVELYICSPSWPSWSVLGELTFTLLYGDFLPVQVI
jgi:hypothetical protein